MRDFKDKVIVVTGGSSGIGKAIAIAFAEQDAKVAIFGRDMDKLKEAQKSLNDSLIVSGDIRHIPDIERLFQETHTKFGKIDGVVVNAGIAPVKHVSDVDESFFDDIVDVNFKGAYFTVQRALPYLQKGSSIVMISSAGAHFGWQNHSVYCSAKAAVSMLAVNFAADLSDRGIRVNAVSPGYIKTPIWGSINTDEFKKDVPMHRFGTPEEIADAVLFLSSSKASYITGIDLVVDGGLTSFWGD
jgi:NAD(P)-dependent dehydrogenase (short-subunit alcohol dehydrogenase family)